MHHGRQVHTVGEEDAGRKRIKEREGNMRLITILGRNDEEIMIDMDVKRPEVPPATYFRRWMKAQMPSWGVPLLVVAGIGTAVSIITMVLKHV
jgi:hypothetical protein